MLAKEYFIAIYNDEGVGNLGFTSLFAVAAEKLRIASCGLGRFHLSPISAKQILQGELHRYQALIVGGGADLPYLNALGQMGCEKIVQFVAQGGHYLGICAGAYFACDHIDFTGENSRIVGERYLKFFPGCGKGAFAELAHHRLYDGSSDCQKMIQIIDSHGNAMQALYYGGCGFVGDSAKVDRHFFYPNGLPAVISGQWGKGSFLLSGVHFEYDSESYRCTQGINTVNKQQIYAALQNGKYGEAIWQKVAKLICKE
ncbi:BPL-N domain-containing protein [Actinobacillus delphinicola]|uniref:Uncharacterized conserved protein n=1 Tax=Actinobacillus delphinicola TaxID=51161 RepID=A0A448TW08_9PAST|nr:BPL-N domain-containing protein [Actinobacillus delphinicola]VEJ10122.1 Uncharacterized conserved protein [Actinobacillus delphinicola]